MERNIFRILCAFFFVFNSAVMSFAQVTYEDDVNIIGCEDAKYRDELRGAYYSYLDCIAKDPQSQMNTSNYLDGQVFRGCLDVLRLAYYNNALTAGAPINCTELGGVVSCMTGRGIDIIALAMYVEQYCPANQGIYLPEDDSGSGSGGTGSGSSGSGNDSEDNTGDPCTCCGKYPCVCSICDVCGGVYNSYGSGCTSCTCDSRCPDVSGYTLIDSKNTNRRVRGTNQTLFMVSNGSARTAQFILNTDFNNWQPGYPQWTGNGISSNGGNIAVYNGTVPTGIAVDCGEGCEKFAGEIVIVPESQISLSYKIAEVKSKIDAIGAAVNSSMQALGDTPSSQTVWTASVSGQALEKNVDKYADGTQIGKFYSLSLNGSVSCALPELKIYVCNYGLAQIYGFLNLGTAACGLTLEAVKDPSQANEYSCNGNLALSFNNPGLGVKGIVGVEDIICTIITAQATLSKFEISNGFTVEADGIYNTPKITYSSVNAEIRVEGKFLDDIQCSLFNETVKLIEGGSNPLPKELIYTFNN